MASVCVCFSPVCADSDGSGQEDGMAILTHDAVVGKEPHLIAPFLGCAVFGLSCVVVDKMHVFDVGVEGWVEVGVGQEGGKLL